MHLPMPRKPAAFALGGMMIVVMITVAMPSLYRIQASQKEPGARRVVPDAAGPAPPPQDEKKALEAFLETYRLAPGQNLKLVPPPRPEGIRAWYTRNDPGGAARLDDDPQAMTFVWRRPGPVESRHLDVRRRERLVDSRTPPLDEHGDRAAPRSRETRNSSGRKSPVTGSSARAYRRISCYLPSRRSSSARSGSGSPWRSAAWSVTWWSPGADIALRHCGVTLKVRSRSTHANSTRTTTGPAGPVSSRAFSSRWADGSDDRS